MLKQIKEKLENADCFDDVIDEVIENTPLEQKIQLAVELIKKYGLQNELDDLISSGLWEMTNEIEEGEDAGS